MSTASSRRIRTHALATVAATESTTEMEYEVIVVGAGVIGSATAVALSKLVDPSKVLLLEQFDFGHVHGSSHGDSRIIRRTYDLDHYAKFMSEAYAAWDDIEKETGQHLFTRTGGLDFAIPTADGGCGAYEAVLKANERYDVDCELLSPADVKARFPQFNLQPPYKAIYSSDSGSLHADKCVKALQTLARARGVRLVSQTEVVQIESCKLPSNKGGKGWTLTTKKGTTYACRRCVMCMGSWAGAIKDIHHSPTTTTPITTTTTTTTTPPITTAITTIPLPAIPLVPIDVTVAYWQSREPHVNKQFDYPIFIDYEKRIYGLPGSKRGHVKVCWHGGVRCDTRHKRSVPPGSTASTFSTKSALSTIALSTIAGTTSDASTSDVSKSDISTCALSTTSAFSATSAVEARLKPFVRDWLPDIEASHPAETLQCKYTMTPDEDFVIDTLRPNLVVAAGFSGHGFKLAPVCGRLIAELAMECGDPAETFPFRLSRGSLTKFVQQGRPAQCFTGIWDENAQTETQTHSETHSQPHSQPHSQSQRQPLSTPLSPVSPKGKL